MNLDSLIEYFETAIMPSFPVKINSFMTVGPNFVESHIEGAKAGNRSAKLRLEQFQDYLEAQKK